MWPFWNKVYSLLVIHCILIDWSSVLRLSNSFRTRSISEELIQMMIAVCLPHQSNEYKFEHMFCKFCWHFLHYSILVQYSDKFMHGTVLYSIYCAILNCIVLLIYCYVDIIHYIITKSMCTLWLVNQLWVIVPVNPRKNRTSSELLYKSNKPQVSVGYNLINHLGCW